jgi:hypothetical protein
VNTRQLLAASLIGVAVWLLPFDSALADAIIYDNAGFVQGQQSFVQAFDITTPGTLTVTLSQIPWPDTISGLNLFVSTATGIVGSSMGVGTESMQVDSGVIYAHWFGAATGPSNLGVYGLEITFAPEGVAQVPLPMPLILLFSGLALLAFWLRRRPAACFRDDNVHTISGHLTLEK